MTPVCSFHSHPHIRISATPLTSIHTTWLAHATVLQVVSNNEAALEAARELILLQLDALPPGTVLRGRRVESVTLFGLFVELAPGKSGLVHLSELTEDGAAREVPPQWQVCGGGVWWLWWWWCVVVVCVGGVWWWWWW